MRKLPKNLENPIDNIILFTSDFAVDFLYNLGFTANGVTTLSLIFGLMSVNQFITQNYYKSALLYFISYYFDCLDGHLARKYDMISDFGDYYDHVKDIFVGFLLLYHIGKRYYEKTINIKLLITIIVMTILLIYGSFVHLGCQEIYYDKTTYTMEDLRQYCPHGTQQNLENTMKYTRYFGTGTLTVYLCILILMTNKIIN